MTQPPNRLRRSRARREARNQTDKLSAVMWIVTIGLGTVLVFAIAYAVPSLMGGS